MPKCTVESHARQPLLGQDETSKEAIATTHRVTQCSSKLMAAMQGFSVEKGSVEQPIDHANPGGAKFQTFYQLVSPNQATPRSPIMIYSAGENAMLSDDAQRMSAIYRGSTKGVAPWHTVGLEHRGYGRSTSAEPDQSRPAYVNTTQATGDLQNCIKMLRERFSGPFIAAGWSYGGVLAIKLAEAMPRDVAAVLISSTPMRWPFLCDTTDMQCERVWGPDLYQCLAGHIAYFSPREVGDTDWMRREFLQIAMFGSAMFPKYDRYLHVIAFAARHLSTPWLYRAVRAIDYAVAGQRAWYWSSSRGQSHMARDMRGSDKNSGYTYAYQQATELGTFFTSGARFQKFWPQDEREIRAYSTNRFGVTNPPPDLDLTVTLEQLTQPVVIVRGGKDPWRLLCADASMRLHNATFIDDPAGRNCPDNTVTVGSQHPVADKARAALGQALTQH